VRRTRGVFLAMGHSSWSLTFPPFSLAG
jgi:hypothetical protein